MTVREKKPGLSVREIAVFALLGALMFVSDLLMEILPNVHLIGSLIMVSTLVFRAKALIPLYLYVFLYGLFVGGFAPWWVPYLYIWAVLWGLTMLLPRRLPKKVAAIVYAVVCSLHGFGFGLLYAPAEALIHNLPFEGMVAWWVAGIPFDILHGISNFAAGLLVLPLAEFVKKLMQRTV